MGRMNANPNEGDEYETHRFCSHHGCGYSGIVDSRLREWATKRDVHNNANHRYITTTNYINPNHIYITTTTNNYINANHIYITTTTNSYINANHQDKDKVNMS